MVRRLSLTGLRFFRLRIIKMLNDMVEIDSMHYAAAMLHPKYRHLKMCSASERQGCKRFIRALMKKMSDREQISGKSIVPSQSSNADEPPIKRTRFGQEFETGNLSDELEDDGDELERYLSKHLGSNDFTENPLEFWRRVRSELPPLAKVARQIHCIPATTASVERTFSHGGYVVNERRTSLKPDQLDNILFLRSLQSI